MVVAAVMGKESELMVVSGVDLEKYQGRWYEIATIPSRFQPKDGTNTRATYTLKADGTVGVLNETWSGGKRNSIQGTAWKADPKSDEAKLKVRFWVPPLLPLIPVTGNYYVLALDPDYKWSLVGEPCRKYLWILCREPHLSDDTYERLLEMAVSQGYDVSKMHKTAHPEGGEEHEEGKGDDKHGTWWFKSMLGK
eukprot:TRINITY_DN12632_c0_g1_i1.p2 TRINITY_DN12632_c0_g1~~TRINITY_DN12632_c0_g1_i1.p2  ORF type:complete len:194 (+),score=19.90 TRINITY_DN12632_c0_g1_i1:308-889(+)